MPRRAREISEWDFYHVTIRGVGKQIIFYSTGDRMFLLKRLKEYAEETEVDIIAYCLMDNHVHLLLRANLDNISACMQKLEDSYSYVFNQKYERSGTLFQGRFGSKAICTQSQLLTTIRYIHKNPEKAGMCPAKDYPWSSYDEYVMGQRICNLEDVWPMIGDISGFNELMHGAENEAEVAIPLSYQMSDGEALRVAEALAPEHNLSLIKTYSKQTQSNIISTLYKNGLSIRQIEAVSGIGRGVIQRVVKGVKRVVEYV